MPNLWTLTHWYKSIQSSGHVLVTLVLQFCCTFKASWWLGLAGWWWLTWRYSATEWLGCSWRLGSQTVNEFTLRNASSCIMVKEESNLSTVYMDNIVSKQWHPKKIWELSSPMTWRLGGNVRKLTVKPARCWGSSTEQYNSRILSFIINK